MPKGDALIQEDNAARVQNEPPIKTERRHDMAGKLVLVLQPN